MTPIHNTALYRTLRDKTAQRPISSALDSSSSRLHVGISWDTVSHGMQSNMLEIRMASTDAEWFAALRDHVAKTSSQSSHRHPDQTAGTEQPRQHSFRWRWRL
jgi:hypothetical protein